MAIALYVKLEKPAKKKKVLHADIWGMRKEKYENLFRNDVQTTKWEEIKPIAPYYFFVPKDFALQSEYEKFWKMTDIFKVWSEGVKTHRDHFVVGFTKEEIIQKIRVFTSNLSDELVMEGLRLKNTRDWNLNKAREKAKNTRLEEGICHYSYRVFDVRYICYSSLLLEFDRCKIMKNILDRENFGLNMTRRLRDPIWRHIYITPFITDKTLLSSKDNCYFFPLYLYSNMSQENLFEKQSSKQDRTLNINDSFLQALRMHIGIITPPENILFYIYAILHSPSYRKIYEEYLKIDFPRIPLPPNAKAFERLSELGEKLVSLHLMRTSDLNETEIGFPKTGSNIVEKLSFDERAKKVFINKEQYFEGVSIEVWEYVIGSYQVMQKYLKDRKKRKLTLDEINHYMKVAKAIRLTIELHEKIDEVYGKM